MCRFCHGIAGIVLVAAVAGCSDPGTQDGKVPFKGTPTEPYNSLTNQMKKNAQIQAQKAEEEAKAKEVKSDEPPKAKDAKSDEPPKAKDAKPAEDKVPGKSG